MNNRGPTLLEAIAVLAILAILAALFLPVSVCRPRKASRCRGNLQQLYTLATVYAATHRGEWPTATGADLWLSFRRTVPPLIAPESAEVLHCDVLDHELGADETNYRGPRVPFKELPANGLLAADAEGNHGEGEPLNVVLQDGSVLNAAPGDALWKKCREALAP